MESDLVEVSIPQRMLADSTQGDRTVSDASEDLWGKPNVTRLKHVVGLKHRKDRPLPTHVTYDEAVRMAEAWCLDPVDYGL